MALTFSHSSPLKPVTRVFLPGLPHQVGSDATACRGSDTLLLLNEANELELGLLGAGGGGYMWKLSVPTNPAATCFWRLNSMWRWWGRGGRWTGYPVPHPEQMGGEVLIKAPVTSCVAVASKTQWWENLRWQARRRRVFASFANAPLTSIRTKTRSSSPSPA